MFSPTCVLNQLQDQHYQFIDFERVSVEERQEIEEILRHPSKRVEVIICVDLYRGVQYV